MVRSTSLVLSLGLFFACGGGDAVVPEQAASATTTLPIEGGAVMRPVSVRLCSEVDEESLAGALQVGFVPQRDAAGEVVFIGPIVSGQVDEEALEALESAPCVESVERSDERIMIPTVTP